MSTITSKQLQRLLEKTVGTQAICRIFRKTPMTIYLWRRDRKLPHISIPGDRKTVRFLEDEVRAWARENNEVMYE